MRRRAAFSTLGAPGASVEEIVSIAQRSGCTGVELRCAADEAVHVGMPDESADAVRDTFKAAGLTVLALGTYLRLCADPDSGEQVSSLQAQLRLAARVGAGGVRVFMVDESEDGSGERMASERLAAVADTSAQTGVPVLIETHDSHARTDVLTRFVDRAAERTGCRLGIVWDTVHTWHSGESPATSFQFLTPHLAYLQLRDVATRDEPVPVRPGRGSYPIDELASVLDANGWSGWVSLEWERKWHPDLPPIEDALSSLHPWADGLLAFP